MLRWRKIAKVTALLNRRALFGYAVAYTRRQISVDKNSLGRASKPVVPAERGNFCRSLPLDMPKQP